MKQRIALLVYVDLDPMHGAFHTERSARDNIAAVLDYQIGHYKPIVSYAPDSLQPPNRPPTVNDSQEILCPSDEGPVVPNDVPIAGTAPDNTTILTTADLSMNYTEGNR